VVAVVVAHHLFVLFAGVVRSALGLSRQVAITPVPGLLVECEDVAGGAAEPVDEGVVDVGGVGSVEQPERGG
jgi:hypothetical protein